MIKKKDKELNAIMTNMIWYSSKTITFPIKRNSLIEDKMAITPPETIIARDQVEKFREMASETTLSGADRMINGNEQTPRIMNEIPHSTNPIVI